MAVRTVCTCDRCESEVRSASDLRPFVATLGHEIEPIDADEIRLGGVCRSCGSMLLSVLRSAIENSGPSE